MRIAVGGWLHETNTFSTMLTEYDDFYYTHGADIVADDCWQELASQGHELFPLMRAWAHPSGLVTQECYRRFTDEILEKLRLAMPLDDVFLGLHGAMEVAGIGDGEAAFMREVREVVGNDVFVCGTLDLHGNLSEAFVSSCDFLTSLRTAPHRDGAETRQRAVRLMLDCLEDGTRPVCKLVKLPLLVPGECGVTEVEPARSLFARLPEIDAEPGILVSSIMIGCAWTDCPETTVSILMYGDDAEALRREANALAAATWERRADFKLDMPAASTDDTIRAGLAAPEKPVFISDSGDNTTAGGAGDSPYFLERLLALGVTDAVYAGIADAEAVRACVEAGEGATVDLVIGGRLDQVFAKPLATSARVIRVVADHPAGARVVVDIGGVDTVLQSDRGPFTTIAAFRQMGLDVEAYKLVIVKLGYLFPDLRDYAPKGLMALSPGFGDQRMDRLPFERLLRPIFPLDQDAEWSPES